MKLTKVISEGLVKVFLVLRVLLPRISGRCPRVGLNDPEELV